MDARLIAYEILLRTEEHGAYADAELGRRLAADPLETADRGLATLLVYGTLARQLTLDHTIEHFAGRPVGKIDRPALIAIRLAAFQIAFLDRVPAYAAVDAGVRLVKRRSPRAAGFVNAVLRRIAEKGLIEPDDSDPVSRLSIRVSHPRWLVQRWIAELGADGAERLMNANNEPMPNVLRALTDRADAIRALADRGIEARATRFAPDGLIASRAEAVAGVAVPQSEASQLVVLLLGANTGMRVLDACAAPGGKTAYLARIVGAEGHVTAVDPAPGAAQRIRRMTEGAGAAVEIHETSIERFEAATSFDAVLVDAPCSGLGTLREHPEIRWRRNPADIRDLADRQRSALRAAARWLRPGGILVYSTCTLVAEENEAIVEGFLRDHGEFGPAAPPWDATEFAGLVDSNGCLRTYPHLHDTAGFFAARLQKSR